VGGARSGLEALDAAMESAAAGLTSSSGPVVGPGDEVNTAHVAIKARDGLLEFSA
jgi:hypothetical protein